MILRHTILLCTLCENVDVVSMSMLQVPVVASFIRDAIFAAERLVDNIVVQDENLRATLKRSHTGFVNGQVPFEVSVLENVDCLEASQFRFIDGVVTDHEGLVVKLAICDFAGSGV